MNTQLRYLSGGAALCLSALVAPSASGDIIVDTFDSFSVAGIWPLVVNAGTPSAANSEAGVVGVVGGVRDAVTDFQLGILNVSATPIVTGEFTVSSDTLTDGRVTLTYSAGGAGLSLNLTNAVEFVLDVNSSDLGGVPIDVTFTDGSSTSNTVSGVAAGATQLNLSLTGLTLDVTDIDEIEVTIDPSSDGDIVIDQLVITETDPDPGTVVIAKETVPAGAAGSFDFNSDLPGAPFTIPDGDSETIVNVAAGTYFVTEVDPSPGFTLLNISCDDANSSVNVGTRTADIELEPGETVTCTFTNEQVVQQTGTIIIQKATTPAGAGPFQFANDIGIPNPFNLSDGQQRTFSNVPIGAYSVTEADPGPLFGLTAIVCDDGNSSGNVVTRTADIQLEAGETVTCAFTNEQLPTTGTISIVKATNPGGGTGFEFSNDIGAPSPFLLDDGQTRTFTGVLPGSYSVTESNPGPLFGLSAVSCDDGNSSGNVATRTADIQLEAGETVTCTFTNDEVPTGTIVIVKTTNPGGGTGFEFSNDIGAPSPFLLDDGQTRTFTGVLAGSYSVTESDPGPLFDLGAVSCDDANSSGNVATRTADIQLEPGETVTCTFTNDEVPPGTVVIVKETVPPAGDHPFDFTTTLGGPFALIDGQSKTFSNVLAGAYTVTEADPRPAFFSIAITCDDTNSTGDPATGIANIQVEPGEIVTCIFTSQIAGTAVPLLGPWAFGILVVILGLGATVFQQQRTRS